MSNRPFPEFDKDKYVLFAGGRAYGKTAMAVAALRRVSGFLNCDSLQTAEAVVEIYGGEIVQRGENWSVKFDNAQ